MNWDYIADAADPRGVEYAATRRAAKAALATQQNTLDLLELQLAQATGNGAEVASRIQARRLRRARWRSFGDTVNVVLCVALIGGAIYFFTAPSGNTQRDAVTTQSAPRVTQAPQGALAPVNLARAPAPTSIDAMIAQAATSAESNAATGKDGPEYTDAQFRKDEGIDNVPR